MKNESIEDVNVKRLTKSKSSRLIRLILTRQSVPTTVRTILTDNCLWAGVTPSTLPKHSNCHTS